MSDFKNLNVWRKSHALALSTFRVYSRMRGTGSSIIRNQVLRSSISVPANIAEGSAKQSDREFARFVRISLGSATEAESHLIIANDLELVADDDFASLSKQLEEVGKMLTGLAKRLTADASNRTRKQAGRR